ncbi:unnamed protein product [Vicia faba]|uniref:Uncharacterized protein n=1 Tax=Vicia faba TaxID=3906 RepID=A0AAV1APH9_VICFA|nr:unnamed protein product [Vicia faba]
MRRKTHRKIVGTFSSHSYEEDKSNDNKTRMSYNLKGVLLLHNLQFRCAAKQIILNSQRPHPQITTALRHLPGHFPFNPPLLVNQRNPKSRIRFPCLISISSSLF